MKRRLRFGSLVVIIMILFSVLAACGTTGEEQVDTVENEVPDGVVEPDENGNGDAPDSTDEPSDNVTESDNEAGDPGNVDQADNRQTITGTFEGLADLHTFEMTTNDVEEGYIAFQFYVEEIGATLENAEIGQEITVTYTKNEHGQYLAEKVK